MIGEHFSVTAGRADYADISSDPDFRQWVDLVLQEVLNKPISANDAYRDEQARIAIAADWLAIANRTPRLPDPEVPAGWKTWALEQVLSGIETLIVRTADRGESIDDHVDLRDATAHLLDCYRNGWTGLLLVDRRRLAAEPQSMRGAA